ncbi:MAG: polysaccharide pyruvyl transferase family protein [Bacteroidales bacterium]|jgi:pyruvyl transferase EpsO|nr:polysaccharide pyruvyl transferase family protein [Bacteroidales bacterium]
MTFQQKTDELKKLIEEALIPILHDDYIHLDLPYHPNIGDTLIWEGTKSFLKTLPYKCLYKASESTFRHKIIPESVIILLHGGGNFGDLWRIHQTFRLKIIKQYPNNKIIILPQTVHYENASTLKDDSIIMAEHKNLTICARDRKSYKILKNNFFNTILLVPDMAFYMDQERLNKYTVKPTKEILLLKRNDIELSKKNNYHQYISEKGAIEIHDWPTMEHNYFVQKVIFKLIELFFFPKNVVDKYAECIYKPFLIRTGIQFISQYKYIYTTRLHVAILSILLQKPFTFFDNSYGKNSSFYDTWLSDIDTIKFIQ